MTYEAFLPFRPTTVVHQAGARSRVALLSGRHILRAAASAGATLWVPKIKDPGVLPGVLRGACHERALFGLALVPESVDPQVMRQAFAPGVFFRAVLDAAEAIARALPLPPFLLHVQEPPLERLDGPQFQAVQDHIARCLDAGFTSFGVDLTACDAAAAPELAATLLSPIKDFELATAVRLKLPPAAGTVTDAAHDVRATLGRLRKAGVDPDLLLLPGPEALGERAFSLAAQIAPLVSPSGVGWRDPSAETPIAECERRCPGLVRCLLGGSRLLSFASAVSAASEQRDAKVYFESTAVFCKLGAQGSVDRLAGVLRS